MQQLKIVTHQVDTMTANKFKSHRKLKAWLRLHPNYISIGSAKRAEFIHIYQEDYDTWALQVDEQRRRERLSSADIDLSEEGSTEGGVDLPSGAEGEESSS